MSQARRLGYMGSWMTQGAWIRTLLLLAPCCVTSFYAHSSPQPVFQTAATPASQSPPQERGQGGEVPPPTQSLQGGEVCETETFAATCAPGHVIVMRGALYGRMRTGRCVDRDYGYIGCQADVLGLLDSLCSGRPPEGCQVPVPSPALRRFASPTCPRDLKPYLEAHYHCVKEESLRQRCSTPTPNSRIPLHAPTPLLPSAPLSGYLSSAVAMTTGRGSWACPWLIRAGRGQLITLTLFDFSAPISPPIPSAAARVQRDVGASNRDLVSEPAKQPLAGAEGGQGSVDVRNGARRRNKGATEPGNKSSKKGSSVTLTEDKIMDIKIAEEGLQASESGLHFYGGGAETPATGVSVRNNDLLEKESSALERNTGVVAGNQNGIKSEPRWNVTEVKSRWNQSLGESRVGYDVLAGCVVYAELRSFHRGKGFNDGTEELEGFGSSQGGGVLTVCGGGVEGRTRIIYRSHGNPWSPGSWDPTGADIVADPVIVRPLETRVNSNDLQNSVDMRVDRDWILELEERDGLRGEDDVGEGERDVADGLLWGHGVEVRMMTSDAPEASQVNYFLIKYQSCVDPVLAEGTRLTRREGYVTVHCTASEQQWRLNCVNGVLQGYLGNCTDVQPMAKRDEPGFLWSHFFNTFEMALIVLISVAVGTGLVVLALGAICSRTYSPAKFNERAVTHSLQIHQSLDLTGPRHTAVSCAHTTADPGGPAWPNGTRDWLNRGLELPSGGPPASLPPPALCLMRLDFIAATENEYACIGDMPPPPPSSPSPLPTPPEGCTDSYHTMGLLPPPNDQARRTPRADCPGADRLLINQLSRCDVNMTSCSGQSARYDVRVTSCGRLRTTTSLERMRVTSRGTEQSQLTLFERSRMTSSRFATSKSSRPTCLGLTEWAPLDPHSQQSWMATKSSRNALQRGLRLALLQGRAPVTSPEGTQAVTSEEIVKKMSEERATQQRRSWVKSQEGKMARKQLQNAAMLSERSVPYISQNCHRMDFEQQRRDMLASQRCGQHQRPMLMSSECAPALIQDRFHSQENLLQLKQPQASKMASASLQRPSMTSEGERKPSGAIWSYAATSINRDQYSTTLVTPYWKADGKNHNSGVTNSKLGDPFGDLGAMCPHDLTYDETPKYFEFDPIRGASDPKVVPCYGAIPVFQGSTACIANCAAREMECVGKWLESNFGQMDSQSARFAAQNGCVRYRDALPSEGNCGVRGVTMPFHDVIGSPMRDATDAPIYDVTYSCSDVSGSSSDVSTAAAGNFEGSCSDVTRAYSAVSSLYAAGRGGRVYPDVITAHSDVTN